MIFEMRQLETRITPNLGNCNRKIDWTTVWFSSVLWIFLVYRTEPENTMWEVGFVKMSANGMQDLLYRSDTDRNRTQGCLEI